ncbi:hypothetical protein D8T51_23940, partial [Vibrio vulnificus]
IKDSITSLLMRPTSVGKDTQHELGQPLKKLAYVSNHRGPLLNAIFNRYSLLNTTRALSG